VLWGKNIITGDAERKGAGGENMENPNPQEVETVYNDYLVKSNLQSQAKDDYDKAQEAVATLRPQADALIKDLWDEIEYKFRKDEPSSLRRKAREYGVVYLTRPEEEEEEGEQPTEPPAEPPTEPPVNP